MGCSRGIKCERVGGEERGSCGRDEQLNLSDPIADKD